MTLLKHILQKYTAALKGLVFLGSAGVFLIAFLDGAFWGIPMDPLIVGLVLQRPHRCWLYVIAAALGSAAGSLVIYYIGRKGEETLLEKRIPQERLQRIRRSFERHEVLALAFPAVLPPPTPFKLFVLFAGAIKMRQRDFLLAIFGGRVVRFTILSLLTLLFGARIQEVVASLVHHHLALSLMVAGVVVVAAWLVFKLQRRRRRPQLSAEEATRS